jgi:hypothetical protein
MMMLASGPRGLGPRAQALPSRPTAHPAWILAAHQAEGTDRRGMQLHGSAVEEEEEDKVEDWDLFLDVKLAQPTTSSSSSSSSSLRDPRGHTSHGHDQVRRIVDISHHYHHHHHHHHHHPSSPSSWQWGDDSWRERKPFGPPLLPFAATGAHVSCMRHPVTWVCVTLRLTSMCLTSPRRARRARGRP